jgi:hypothetical protein
MVSVLKFRTFLYFLFANNPAIMWLMIGRKRLNNNTIPVSIQKVVAQTFKSEPLLAAQVYSYNISKSVMTRIVQPASGITAKPVAHCSIICSKIRANAA